MQVSSSSSSDALPRSGRPDEEWYHLRHWRRRSREKGCVYGRNVYHTPLLIYQRRRKWTFSYGSYEAPRVYDRLRDVMRVAYGHVVLVGHSLPEEVLINKTD